MASTTETANSDTTDSGKRTPAVAEIADGARSAATAVGAGIVGAADAVSARLPEAAATTREAIEDVNRKLRTGSDLSLGIGASFALGLSVGLLLAGAGRLFVAAAALPAVAMGLTLLERTSARGRSQTRSDRA
jgi:hypothetical protein